MSSLTGKKCSKCGGTAIVSLRSINMRKCADCGCEEPWHLDKGQQPLVANNRIKNGQNLPAASEESTNASSSK